MRRLAPLITLLLLSSWVAGGVELGVDRLFNTEACECLRGQRVGLITNQTGMTRDWISTIDLFKQHEEVCELVALFAPEHGLTGSEHAGHLVDDQTDPSGVPIYSLHGKTRRPTPQMIKDVDVLVYDIQDVGTRSYTYATTLFYVMEEAAKWNKKVVVLDRPNPINGVMVDGPLLDVQWRSFIGYINVPFVHGMTIGELACFFNGEYEVGCDLEVVKMMGWERKMSFKETELPWTPPSPQIPEADTPLLYPATNLIGHVINTVSVGVGYTLPFKVVGAPYIDADRFAEKLNGQKLQGIKFVPTHFRPFFGAYKGEVCHGVRLAVTDPLEFRPVTTQFLILGVHKSLYPNEFKKGLKQTTDQREFFYKAVGSEEAYRIIHSQRYIAWDLIALHEKRRSEFLKKRKSYLLYP